MLGTNKPRYRIQDGLALLVLAAGQCMATSADETIAGFRHTQVLSLPDLAKEQLVALPLPDSVYDGTTADFADLRVFNDNVEIPHLIRKQRELIVETVEKRRQAKISDLEKLEDNSIELLVQVPKDTGPVNGISLETPLRDYERSISVYGRPGLEADWETLADQARVYDYSRFADVRSNTITFASGEYSELKLLVEAATDVQISRLKTMSRVVSESADDKHTETEMQLRRPFAISAVHVLIPQTRTLLQSDVLRDYEPVALEITSDKENSNREIVSIKTRRQPITRLRIECATQNFRRTVRLKTKADNRQRHLASDVIWNLDYHNIREQDRTLECPETRSPHLRLEILNGDNPPIDVTNVKMRGPSYELVFLARPKTSYALFYGNPDAAKPKYDIQTLKRLLDETESEPVLATALSHQPNPARVPPKQPWLSGPAFFFGVIFIMIVVLGAALVSAAGKTPDKQ